MPNKKVFVILGIIVVLIGAAVFVAGRMLNQDINSLGLGPSLNGRDQSVLISLNPAPELPTTPPEVTGLFVERQDNTLVISSISLPAGGVFWAGAGLPSDDETGPKVEVVIAADTLIYRETTEFDGASASGNQTIQQTVGTGTLDDVHGQSFVTVWGRKSGDRIIAEILFYSNSAAIQEPEPEEN